VPDVEAKERPKESQDHVRKLVERGQAGDRDALEELYLIHFDRIYSYLHMSVGNRHDAEDLTTQTFLKMLESIGRFRWQSAPFSAWLFRIAHNLAMDHFRARRRWQPEEEVPEPIGSEEPSAELAAMHSIGRQSMLEMIEKLSPEQQQVLTLKFVFNFPNADVAKILDKTEGAIKSLQHRALAALQKQIQSNDRGVAREVGIVGLQSSGKSLLFEALTGTKAHGEVGMAAIPDPRLGQLADVVQARKVTPAAIRVVEVRGTGPALLGNLRQVDALLVVLDGFSGTRVAADDLETLKLELLVADRDHVERRLERVAKQAKSGDAKLKKEVEQLEALLARLDTGETATEWPPELDPLTTKPLISIVNGPDGADLKLEAELAELPPEEAAEFRGGGESALGSVVRQLAETLDLITFFTAGEKETRAWTLRRGETALDAAATIHSDIARGFIRCEVVRWDDLVAAGSHAEASRAGKQRLEGKTYEVQDGDVLNIRFNV
jgi:RNA polymerase sigma factor (sigma-70 family)